MANEGTAQAMSPAKLRAEKNKKIPNPSINATDNIYNFRIPVEVMDKKPVMVAGKPTGAEELSYTKSYTKTQVENGESVKIHGENGKVEEFGSLKLVYRRYDPSKVSAQREAKRAKNFFTHLRRQTGLTVKKDDPVQAKDVVTIQDLHRWFDTRDAENPFKIRGYTYNGMVAGNEENVKKYNDIMKKLQTRQEKDQLTSASGVFKALLAKVRAGQEVTEEEYIVAEATLEALEKEKEEKAKRTEQAKENLKQAKKKQPEVTPEETPEVVEIQSEQNDDDLEIE
jgi:hypothetical protein